MVTEGSGEKVVHMAQHLDANQKLISTVIFLTRISERDRHVNIYVVIVKINYYSGKCLHSFDACSGGK